MIEFVQIFFDHIAPTEKTLNHKEHLILHDCFITRIIKIKGQKKQADEQPA